MSDYMNPGDPFDFGQYLNELAKPVPVVPKKKKRAAPKKKKKAAKKRRR